MTKRGLGRGLDVFFGESPAVSKNEQIFEINILEIIPNPFQPRKIFNDDTLNELAKSIILHGVLQPIILRKNSNMYQIISGERRWKASKIADKKTIPAVIREYPDEKLSEIALIENLQRDNLNPIEEAFAYRRLMQEFCLTQEEVSLKIGRSRSYVANILRLNKLHPEIQNFISSGILSMGQAKPLLGIEDHKEQYKIAQQILNKKSTSRDVEQLIKLKKSYKTKNPVSHEYLVIEAENKLKNFFGSKVKINHNQNKGKIEITYSSPEELEKIIKLFTIKIS